MGYVICFICGDLFGVITMSLMVAAGQTSRIEEKENDK